MGPGQTGLAFLKHLFDELLCLQGVVIRAEEALAPVHPRPSARRAIRTALAADREALDRWERVAAPYGATGEADDPAAGLMDLMEQALTSAASVDSDLARYEAHAVLVTLKRRQVDVAKGIARIATAIGDRDLRATATAFERSQRPCCRELARELAVYAMDIAMQARTPSGKRASRRVSVHGHGADARPGSMVADAR